MYPDSSVKYLISIVRKKSSNATYEFLKTEDYKNSFSNETSRVLTSEEINYASLKGVRVLTKITTPQRIFLNYSVSTIVEEDRVVVSYNTIENNFQI